jgi:PAS domain S-box-containing protein
MPIPQLGFTPCDPRRASDIVGLHSFLGRIRNRLAHCYPEDVDQIIVSALHAIRGTGLGETSRLFALSQSGKLSGVCAPAGHSDIEMIVRHCLRTSPERLSQLLIGQPVVVAGLNDLDFWMSMPRAPFQSIGPRSIALIPSSASARVRGLFVVFSKTNQNEWSSQTIDECLEFTDILWSAYQREFTQDEKRADELRLMRLFRVSSVGVALLDQDGILISANKAFVRATGYAEDQLLMKSFDTVFCDTNAARHTLFWRRLSRVKYLDCQIKRRIVRKDGSLASATFALMSLDASLDRPPHFLAMIENLVEADRSYAKLDSENRGIRSVASQLIRYQEEERKRLSRELHDGIGQSMSLITSEIALMASQYAGASPALGDRLALLREQLDHVCSDLHCMSHNLHSYKLQHLGLKCAVRDLCRQLSSPELQVDFDIDHCPEPRSRAVSLCLYRVAQEALSNCVKHSHTRTIELTLTKLRNTFHMTVKDCGIGFNLRAKSDGLGLVSMRERLTLVDGSMKVRSRVGLGTEIWVSAPEETDQPATEDASLEVLGSIRQSLVAAE